MPTIGCLSRLRTFRTKSSISSTESGSSCKPREQSALRVQDRSKTHAHAASNARGDCGQRTGRAHNKARAHTPRSVPTPRYGNNHQHACAGLPRECRRYAMDKANSTRAHASVFERARKSTGARASRAPRGPRTAGKTAAAHGQRMSRYADTEQHRTPHHQHGERRARGNTTSSSMPTVWE